MIASFLVLATLGHASPSDPSLDLPRTHSVPVQRDLFERALEEASADEPAPPPVTQGTQVPEGRWMDTAAVYLGRYVGCTGVLIAPDVVMTAGHCNDNITKVEMGVNDYTDDGEMIDAAETIEYPNSQRTLDITAIVLEEESSIEPRVIAQDCILEEHYGEGSTVTIVGYGATNRQGTQYGTELLEGDTFVTDPDCTDTSGCNNVDEGSELAAGGNGTDACYGDSGGPLYLPTEDGDYLIGLTSRGANGNDYPCGEIGIYVRADAFKTWVEDETGRELPSPDCIPNRAPEASAKVIVLEWDAAKGRTEIDVDDEDEDDEHSFEIDEEPEHGEAEVGDDGTVIYTADADATFPDEFTVLVSDNGSPVETAELTIKVFKARRCSCATGGESAGWTAAGVLALALARRRRARQVSG